MFNQSKEKQVFRFAIVCFAFCSVAVVNAQEAHHAARVGDRTASGGVVVTGSDSVTIEGQPAAREGDMTTNPTTGTVQGVGGAIRKGGQTGAGDQVVTGASSVFIGNNVFINGQSAATAAPTPKPMDPDSVKEGKPSEATQKLLKLYGEKIEDFVKAVFAHPKSSQ